MHGSFLHGWFLTQVDPGSDGCHLHSAGSVEKCPWSTLTEEHQTEAEYFRCEKEKGQREDEEESDDGEEEEKQRYQEEDTGPVEAAPEPRVGMRTEEDAGQEEAVPEP
ncbi:hypothetical protein NDU88_005655 [Pleurodeles waltl]|uniref:Uncharacterized protein n=1 Tax=Pleurodeles waltl TaxID=8319 RepID=A0AAV7VN88_PLEWA|nr:hypothetical protein NDU88_005655 [Pleurodeles waltl]